MEKVKVALFDIDKTIIKGDSMFKILGYTLRKYPKAILGIVPLIFKLFKYKVGLINTKTAKESMFYILKYLNKDDLYDFYKQVLKKNIYCDAENRMKELYSRNYKIILVSASPECYLKYFEEEEFIDFVIGTRLYREGNNVKNKIIGENCKGEEKVRRINEYLRKLDIIIDKENSVAFSDSLSDIPMFNLVNKAYLINYNKNHNKYEILKWN